LVVVVGPEGTHKESKFMRAGVPMAPAIIEDRRRTVGSLMIARADGEPLTFHEGIASGVLVTVIFRE
jgi:hypothetical protein